MTTDLGDPTGYVRLRLEEACAAIDVDVDAEWHHLQDRIARERAVVGGWDPPAKRFRSPAGRLGRYGPSLIAAAAAVVLLATVATRPVTIRIVVEGVASARDAVLGRSDPPPIVVEATTTVPPSTAPPAPTTTAPPLPPPPTTTPPAPAPAPTTTVPAAPAIGNDPAHEAIVNGDEYRLTIRRVHEQLNDAIGFRRENYRALEGSDRLIESLLGQRPEFDRELRDVIGHLRQAQRASDRNAASAAHTIISSIEGRLAAEG